MEQLDPQTSLSHLNIAHGTHEGMVGKNNEDSLGFFVWQSGEHPFYLGVVADGVGGQTAGETASYMTVEIIEKHFSALEHVDEKNILAHIDEAVKDANYRVYERALDDETLQGMATTIVVAAVYEDRLYTSHVGDSRIYLWRNNVLHQLTLDHSWVQEAVTAGLLTAEQAKTHPNRNIIRRSLGGMSDVEVDQQPISNERFKASQGMALQEGDIVLLCSDGLTDMINENEIIATLTQHEDKLDTAVEELIDKANIAGGRDNITVILMQRQSSESKPTATPPMTTPVHVAAAEPKITISNSNPHIVPVPLDKQYREEQARKRRLLYIAILILLIIVLLLIVYFRWFASST